MYKIGEFADKVQTSIRTLRYYDKIDLFKPDEIDLFTGYRYYSESQIADFNLIIKLKSIGFSLEEIRDNWGNFNDRIMLLKKAELLCQKKDIDKQIKELDKMRLQFENKKHKEDIKILRKD